MTAPNVGNSDEGIGNPYEPPVAPLGSSAKSGGQRETGWNQSAPGAFSVGCACGELLAVKASQASTNLRCDCGAQIKVPSLGQSRELAGKERYESGIIDAIGRMIRSGELPRDEICAISQRPTTDVLEIDVHLPRLFKTEKEAMPGPALLLGGLLGVLVLSMARRSKYAEEEESIIRVPLRVGAEYQSKVRVMSPRRLKKLLRRVPIYAKLLDENPDARIEIAAC